MPAKESINLRLPKTPEQMSDLEAFKELQIVYRALHLASAYVTAREALGFTGIVTTAKLTTAGTNGSMTFDKGILVAVVAAT